MDANCEHTNSETEQPKQMAVVTDHKSPNGKSSQVVLESNTAR